MENINTIKFFIFIIMLFSIITAILINNLVADYKLKEQKLNVIIDEILKENHELKVYKAKKEFSSKIINKLKNATKKEDN